MNERISIPLNRKSVVPLALKKDLGFSHEVEKLLPVGTIFEELEQNAFH